MTDAQHKAILDYCFKGAARESVSTALGFDIDQSPSRIARLLEESAKSVNADDVEMALILVAITKLPARTLVCALIELLGFDWHRKHEDIAILLQEAADPRAIEALYRAAQAKHDYLNYDDHFALARKCCFALGRIGTPEALAKLRLLAASANPQIVAHAREQLDGLAKA